MKLKEAQEKMKRFVQERGWGSYHTPRNLVLSLNIEAGELLSLVEWMSDEQVRRALRDQDFNKAVRNELADIFHYLLSLCNQLDIDLVGAFNEKFENSNKRFPIGKSKKFDPVAWKIKKIKEKKEVRL